jgi:hypothetical protein
MHQKDRREDDQRGDEKVCDHAGLWRQAPSFLNAKKSSRTPLKRGAPNAISPISPQEQADPGWAEKGPASGTFPRAHPMRSPRRIIYFAVLIEHLISKGETVNGGALSETRETFATSVQHCCTAASALAAGALEIILALHLDQA